MNIILLGMPLSGKTTIGKIISKDLSMKRIDLDEQIENLHRDSIYELFLNFGEQKFREIEHESLDAIDASDSHILSIGGGAASELNSEIISSYSIRVWLKCSLDTIIARYRASKEKRPLLYNTNNLVDKLQELYNSRNSLFNDLSNIKIDTSEPQQDETAKQIMMKIHEIN